MSEPALSFEMFGSAQRHSRQVGEPRREKARSSTRSLYVETYHLSGPESPTSEVSTSVRLFFIGHDLAMMPKQLRRAFPAPAHRVQVSGTVRAGLERTHIESPDVIVLDLGHCDQSALEVYKRIHCINPQVPLIVVADARRTDAAIELIKEGAFDCLFKPLDLALLQRVVNQALDVIRPMRQPAAATEIGTDSDSGHGMIGVCPAISEVYKAIGRVAAQDVPVLITGESGTGKELVARAIYQHGLRARAPFVALNCAAIPETLLESELFGHEKGAFTGATQRRVGRFEQCSGGTLFLDEVGDMPAGSQAKVLRLLQEQTFERVGGNETIHADVRLIAATHRDLKTWSADGRFRPDLYYRLGVFNIHLPPLRERADDLPLLIRHYLRRFSSELGREVREVAAEALERLRGYSWPGNVRELQSVLKQALLRSHGPVLLADFLPQLAEASSAVKPGAPPGGHFDAEAFLRQRLRPDAGDLYAEVHRELDRLLLPRVLDHAGGKQAPAARLLGIARRTLHTKLRELGLRGPHPMGADADRRT
jgi:two-component system nitrogen regulation response regulator GlnG